MKAEESIIRLMNKQRKGYADQQRFHYLTFAAYSLILLLDFIVIIYTRVITLNAYAWTGIVFLFVLMAVEGKQYLHFKKEKENIDEFYLRGEYAKSKI
jgi:hypothetical protein